MPGAAEIAVLSNRGPLSFVHDERRGLVARRGAGGLVAALGPGVEHSGSLWLATAITEADREAARAGEVEAHGFKLRSLAIDEHRYRAYYDVFANGTLWFLHHGLWDLVRRPRFDRHWWEAWEAYCEVNSLFAEAATEQVAEDGIVLIEDYHLSLVGAELARLRPDLRTVAFVHTPFCTPTELEILPEPVASTILLGLSGAGACGFHRARWARCFEACCAEVLGTKPTTFVSPAAPDNVTEVAASAECDDAVAELDRLVGSRRVIVRVDRIEPSKNLLRGFYAFEALLEEAPALRGEVVFCATVYPSRQSMAEYLAYGREVEVLVERINARYGTADWTPILLDTRDDFVRSVAALRRYDVLVVNPVRDGLNLVAKEGPLVNEHDGVLALSRAAGAWDELSEHALDMHPFDIVGAARTLRRALEMSSEERAERAAGLRKASATRTPLDWWAEQVAAARRPSAPPPSERRRRGATAR